MDKRIENIALFDMDGTLCNYDLSLALELEKLKSPSEPTFHLPIRDDAPEYIKARANMIKKDTEWWANIPQLKLGFDIWELAEELEYDRMVLTQGPKKNPNAWAGKKIWIDKNLGEETGITITRDKGLVYGKVLIDDYPPYMERWLTWRPRGLGIMPISEQNKDYKNRQVIKYDGTNLKEVKNAMEQTKLRE